MKIISLNVRGLGKEGKDKIRWVKSLIAANNPDILALQETKLKNVKDNFIEFFWGSQNFKFAFKSAVGKSGCIILIWDPNKFSVNQLVEKDFFLVIKGCWIGKSSDTIVINVYGLHCDTLKRKFWESLELTMQENFEEWILYGDFNEVRKSSGRKNCIFMEHRARMFNEFIDKVQLIEIPLGGMKFTRICDEGIKYSKLYRFLVSEKVAATWEGLTACSLERRHSDHCPIMLKDSNTDFGPKPVTVFNSWIDHEESLDIIKRAWILPTRNCRADCVVRDKLKNVKEGLKTIFNPRFNNLNAEISKLQKDVEKWENSLGNRDLNELEIATWIETRKKWL
ncbi:uncharacterized protein [Rutidosis leptorrhynchoides]|uniref:uncharacterized protein n=1 Tax=Rutidosis leptorrhynchoides TaxID=125765 RepID=UPI003A98FA4E